MDSFSIRLFRRYTPMVSSANRFLDPLFSSLVLFLVIRLGDPYTWTAYDTIVIILVPLLVVLVFGIFDLYRSWRGTALLSESRRIFVAWFAVLCLLVPLAYAAMIPHELLNKIIFPFSLLVPLILSLERIFLRLVLRYFRKQGRNLRTVIIVGAGDLGRDVSRRIQEKSGFGLKVVGFFDDKFEEGFKTSDNLPILGSLKDLPHFAKENHG